MPLNTFWTSAVCAAALGSSVSTGAMAESQSITAQAIADADVSVFSLPGVLVTSPGSDGSATRSPAITKIEILLDRVGASPGVIDGLDGENLRKAADAYEMMVGQKPDGKLTAALLQTLQTAAGATSVMGTYTVTAEDIAAIVPPIPADYGEMSKRNYLGYTSVAEELAERFHMDEKLLGALNPDAKFAPGETIYAAVTGAPRQGSVTRIEADKDLRQVRGYDASGALLVAYPATIGSTDTPSPSGQYSVVAVAQDPTYTYNPDVNFKQGDNDKVLTIPPGPNGPVGSVWIALSKPTFGIHGTPEPSLIDKAASHGCIRLTNWDAEELSKLVAKGVTVDFLPERKAGG